VTDPIPPHHPEECSAAPSAPDTTTPRTPNGSRHCEECSAAPAAPGTTTPRKPDSSRHCEERSGAAIQGPPGPLPGPREPQLATHSTPASIGPLTPDRLHRLLTLNNAHAAELSFLDAPRLAHILHQSAWAARIGDVDAFVLTLDQTATYDSPNYAWWRAHLPRFLYVDRIVVSPAARGRGLARTLYAAVFAAAQAAGHTAVTAEVNTDPPNPASDALHAALGFQQAGTATIHGGAKTVRYLIRPLP